MTKIIRVSSIYLLALAITVLSSYSNASAQVSFTNNLGQFTADNPGLSIQDFSAANAPFGNVIPCTIPVNQNSNDQCFSPGDILAGIEFNDVDDGGTIESLVVLGEDLIGFNDNPPNLLASQGNPNDIQIDFTQDVNTVGLSLGCINVGPETCRETIIINVFGMGDVLIGSTSLDVTDLANSFVGINSTQEITRIYLDSSEFVLKTILNVRFGQDEPVLVATDVPTLSEWGLIAMAGVLGVVGVMVMRRKKVTA